MIQRELWIFAYKTVNLVTKREFRFKNVRSRFTNGIFKLQFTLGKIKGIPRKLLKRQIEELLQIMNLSHVAGEKMKSLSGGMRQRVLLIQALLGEPQILVLDEPTAGLDPKERVSLKKYIKSISKNKIIIITTHVVSDVENIADCVIFMREGNMLAQGTLNDLLVKTGVKNLEELYLLYMK